MGRRMGMDTREKWSLKLLGNVQNTINSNLTISSHWERVITSIEVTQYTKTIKFQRGSTTPDMQFTFIFKYIFPCELGFFDYNFS